jgi:ribosomal-protein-alanine N-acetyltransferase
MIVDVISGQRVTLRPLDEKHATNRYLEWMQSPCITRYMEVRWQLPQSVTELKDYILMCNESSNTLLFGIFSVNDSQHIGNIKIGSIDWNNRTCWLGYFIGDQSVWGKGYATESVNLATSYAFTRHELRKICAGVIQSNAASVRVLQRCGYVLEGQQYSQWVIDGIGESGLLFGKVRQSVYQNGDQNDVQHLHC